jgi:hypothetical protein
MNLTDAIITREPYTSSRVRPIRQPVKKTSDKLTHPFIVD